MKKLLSEIQNAKENFYRFLSKLNSIIDDKRCWSTSKKIEHSWPHYHKLKQKSSLFKYRFNLAALFILTNIIPVYY